MSCWSIFFPLDEVCVLQSAMPSILKYSFSSRFHQSAPVHRLPDHHDKGPHLPPVRHSPHVSGYEVSNRVCVSVCLCVCVCVSVCVCQSSPTSLNIISINRIRVW